MSEIKGTIFGISGPTVTARGLSVNGEASGDNHGVKMHSVCRVGPGGLLSEVIRIEGDLTTLQVYEDTTGLKVGDEVVSSGEPLTALLGPGLLSRIFDGIQRPIDLMEDDFIEAGGGGAPFDLDKGWAFSPLKSAGDAVLPGDILGTIQETKRIVHRVMVPPPPVGRGGTIKEIRSGTVSGREALCTFEDGSVVGLYHEWPVRTPRPIIKRLPPERPFTTGQRIFDTILPVADGGTAIVPGGFGTGKTIVEQTLAKFGGSDVVLYIGCGERGNEMTEILTDFPSLTDPTSGLPLSMRTVIVINTSNMPVAAREASIFTGITIAEYFRDMGYSVALMADSISRWAEALREISSRLEEMPGEEGFPPYLATRLGSFYERAGRVHCLGRAPEGGRGEGSVETDEHIEGAVTIISAVSPPGGDFSEPVTQASMRFAGAFWALDKELAYRRHFPAVNWQSSFSLYYDGLKEWFMNDVSPEMVELRSRLLTLLQREADLKEIVQIIGVEALQETDRLCLEAATVARETFLRQSVFNEFDCFNTYNKQHWMLKAIFAFYEEAGQALGRGVYMEDILEGPYRGKVMELQFTGNDDFEEVAKSLIDEMGKAFAVLGSGTSGESWKGSGKGEPVTEGEGS